MDRDCFIPESLLVQSRRRVLALDWSVSTLFGPCREGEIEEIVSVPIRKVLVAIFTLSARCG